MPVIEFFVKKDLKAMEIHAMMVKVVGESAQKQWFVNGHLSFNVVVQALKIIRVMDVQKEIIEQLHVIASEDPSVTTRKIAHTIFISNERVWHILHTE